jgi:hypothetical protein
MTKINSFSQRKEQMPFSHLQLATPILKALNLCGYSGPTPIQEQAIPRALEGLDLIASAQTGPPPHRRSSKRRREGAARSGTHPDPGVGKPGDRRNAKVRKVHAHP